MSLLHRPTSKSVVDSLDSVEFAGTPSQDVPKERVGRFGRVIGSQRALDLHPVVLVQVLLSLVGQAHEEPVLDFFALRQGTAGGVQALEDLLRIFPVAESDANDSEPLESREQKGQVMPGDQAPEGSPGLRHGAGTRRITFETAPVLFLVFVLEPQLPISLLARIRQPIIADDLRRPVAACTLLLKPVRNAGQEDAHRRQPLLTVDHADGLHHARRHPRLREGQECTAVVRSIGAGRSDRQEILNEPFDVRLTPTVSTLPAWHNVLDRSVEELKKLDVLRLHGATVKAVA